MKKIKYALIGFGGIAENRIAKEGFALDKTRFRPLPGVELAGATDINRERKKAAEALGITWFDASRDVFANPDIDAVFISTNNLSHFPLAKNALKSGKHVIVEKPLATKTSHARELIQLAKKNNLSLAVDHMMVYNAYNVRTRDLITSGALGDVNDLTLHMEFSYGSTPVEAATWRCSNVKELGGPIGDVASHCFYMAEFLLGDRIRSIRAVYYPKTLNIKAEDGAFIRFETGNGLVGSIRVSFCDPRGNLHSTLLNLGYEIYGTGQSLHAYGTLFQLSGHAGEPIKLKVELHKENTVKEVMPGKIRNIYQEVIGAHAKSIRENAPFSGEDALHNLKLILAAHDSAAKAGKEIHI